MQKIISSLGEGDLSPFGSCTAVRLYNSGSNKWFIGILFSARMQTGSCILRISPYMQFIPPSKKNLGSVGDCFFSAFSSPVPGSYIKLTGSFLEDQQPFFLSDPKKIELEDGTDHETLTFESKQLSIVLSRMENDFYTALKFLDLHKPPKSEID